MSQRRGSAWGCTERRKRSRRTDCKLSCAPVCFPEPSKSPASAPSWTVPVADQGRSPSAGGRRAQVVLKVDGKRGTVVRGDGEVAALVELSRREAGPVAVDAATADASAQHPDDVSEAMVAVVSIYIEQNPMC
jgi:hypothetical protein